MVLINMRLDCDCLHAREHLNELVDQVIQSRKLAMTTSYGHEPIVFTTACKSEALFSSSESRGTETGQRCDLATPDFPAIQVYVPCRQ